MDFIVKLPESQGHDAIFVVVDRLTKYKHFIPCKEKHTGAEHVAHMYIDRVWKHHGLPERIVSDRGSQFVGNFWKQLTKRLDIKSLLSTTAHPETDGQTERANSQLEQYLRTYVTYMQDDWVNWLPLAEVAINTIRSSTTGVTPFFANYGHEARMGFEPSTPINHPAARRAEDFAAKMNAIWDYMKSAATVAQLRQRDYADQRHPPAPSYRVGQKVWLDTRNIKTLRPSKKLDWKNVGQLTIIEKVSDWAYRLDLPASMKIHPMFNVSLLRPAYDDHPPGQIAKEQPPVIVNGNTEWEVEEVVDSRWKYSGRRRTLHYSVKWIGDDMLTEEPWQNLENAPDAVRTFHQRYPHKPGPA